MTPSSPAADSAGRLQKASVRRLTRKQAFADFHAASKARIAQLTPSVPHWLEYADYYQSYVLPGGWNGGTDPDVVDIIFGNRIVDSAPSPSGKGAQLQSERGAWLNYERQLSGQVFVTLCAARLSVETGEPEPLLLDQVTDASQLTDARLRRHLRDLAACMAASTLDDARTWTERGRAAWLRWVKPTFGRTADGGWGRRTPRYQTSLLALGHWVLTIGLSGTILFAVQRWFPSDPSPPTDHQQLQARIETALDDAAALRMLLQRDLEASRRLRATIEADLAALRAEQPPAAQAPGTPP